MPRRAVRAVAAGRLAECGFLTRRTFEID